MLSDRERIARFRYALRAINQMYHEQSGDAEYMADCALDILENDDEFGLSNEERLTEITVEECLVCGKRRLSKYACPHCL